MISYTSGLFGFSILLRIHGMNTYLGLTFSFFFWILIVFLVAGSALYKALLPALISSAIYILLSYSVDINNSGEKNLLLHPYPIGALISALTFLLAFRANFSYNRYWEAVSAVHQMHSKWVGKILHPAVMYKIWASLSTLHRCGNGVDCLSSSVLTV